MSDWMPERPPQPTLAVQFPWQQEPLLTCLNCNKRVSTIHAKRHVVIPGGFEEEGCGIEFKFIATAAADREGRLKVSEMRPDLDFKEINWA